MEDLCKNASHKIHALVRIMPCVDFLKKKMYPFLCFSNPSLATVL